MAQRVLRPMLASYPEEAHVRHVSNSKHGAAAPMPDVGPKDHEEAI